MAKLVWDKPEDRTYEAGLDRGVLQVENEEVVSWDGLVSVTDDFKGGDLTPLYQDGFRAYNFFARKEFAANITSLGYPDVFSQCEGVTGELGLFIDQQPPKTFNFSYRTGIRFDTSNRVEYKLHLVYNCSVLPNSKTYKTISRDSELLEYSWDVETVPVWDISEASPSSHFFISSIQAPPLALSKIEDILYGTETTDPRFLAPSEIKTILGG